MKYIVKYPLFIGLLLVLFTGKYYKYYTSKYIDLYTKPLHIYIYILLFNEYFTFESKYFSFTEKYYVFILIKLNKHFRYLLFRFLKFFILVLLVSI